MAEVVSMPKLGFDMAEGVLVRWVKSEGDSVERGEVLAEIETDKATVEVESQASGIIHRHLVSEGSRVPVGDPIAVVGEQGEEVDVDALMGDGSQRAESPKSEVAPQPDSKTEAEPQAEQPDRAERTDGRGDGQLPGGVKASPVARRIAEERGVDLSNVQGSGPGGRIVRADVEQAPAERETPAERAYAYPETARATERIERTGLRRTIGKRMTQSKQEVPHFYVTADLDAGPLMALRDQVNQALPDEEKVSVNDVLVKAASLSLRKFPNINASLDGDTVVRHGDINIGIAVAIDGGLMTVVAHDADKKPLSVLARESKPLIERARQGKIKPEDVEGATFTISNMGMYDVDHFIAIINPPEAAILAVGSVRTEPVVQDGELTVGRRLKVTLSADHRVTDGAEAAQFLQEFRRLVETPVLMLV